MESGDDERGVCVLEVIVGGLEWVNDGGGDRS